MLTVDSINPIDPKLLEQAKELLISLQDKGLKDGQICELLDITSASVKASIQTKQLIAVQTQAFVTAIENMNDRGK